MTLDERTLQAAGLPASLISLLVSITKAADRATAAANTAATANDLAPQIAAALQALQDMEVVPGLRTQVDQLRERLLAIENSPPPDSYDDTAVINRLAVVEAAAASIPQPYNDGPILQRIATVEGALAESVEIVSLISRDGLLVALLSNGSEIIGPEIGGGSAPITAPAIVSTIADRLYIVGQSVPATDLRTKFSGAASYLISPAISQAVINGYNLEFYPSGTLSETTITVQGVNAGGLSDPLTFKLRIDAASPEVVNPLPDQNIAVGSGTITIPLDDRFAGATTYLVAPEGQGAAIVGRNLVLSTADERSLEVTVTATNNTGQSVSDTFMFIVGAVTQAPSVHTAPSVSGSTTVGSILTRTAGSATGIPTPSRATVWLHNGTTLDGQTGNTLDTSGFAADDAITTRDVWTNTVNGQTQTATGTSDPWTLTVQPAITATISPNPLVAGQPFTIVFNVSLAANEISSSVSLAGSGTTRTGTAPEDDTTNVSIGATKSGYKAFSGVYDVVPDEPEFSVATVEGTSQISGTGDLTWTLTAPAEYAGTFAVDQSEEYGGALNIDYTEDTAPQCIVAPVIARRSGPGATSNHYPGTEYEFTPPLWQTKAGAAFTEGWEWHEDGVATGFKGLTFNRAGAGPVEVVSWIDVAGQPRRTSKSAAVAGEALITWSSWAGVSDDTRLNVATDAAGRIWKRDNVNAELFIKTATDSVAYVRALWGPNFAYCNYVDNEPGVLAALAKIKMAPAGQANQQRMGVMLHLDKTPASPTLGQFYYALLYPHSRVMQWGRGTNGVGSSEAYTPVTLATSVESTVVTLKLTTQGNDVVVFANGAEIARKTDTTLARSGIGGLASWADTPTAERAKPYGLFTYDVEK